MDCEMIGCDAVHCVICGASTDGSGLCDKDSYDEVREVSEHPEFDPEDWTTWPVPEHGINSRRPDGRIWRLSPWGDGWIDGLEMGLRMAEHFHKTGEWMVVA